MNYAEIPRDWALCLTNGCPQAANCLRHVSHVEWTKEATEHVCVLPQACRTDGHCPMFATKEPVTLAWGMRELFSFIRNEDEQRVRADLIKLFGDRRRFYRFREGRWVISPTMQEAIVAILRKHGYTRPPKFDLTKQSVYFPGRTDYIFRLDA